LWFSYNGSTFQPPPGEFSTLTQSGSLYIRTLTDGTKINFDSTSGRQLSIVDRNNNALTFNYDGSWNLTSIKDFNNQITTFTYTGSRVTSITDPVVPTGRVTNLGYNGSNQLISISDPDPGFGGSRPVMTFGFDGSSDRINDITDPRSNDTIIAYDGTNNRVTSVTQPYPLSAHKTVFPQQRNGAGDSTGVLAAESQGYVIDEEGNQWYKRYDWLGFGRATQELDPRTDVTALKIHQLDANGLTWLNADQLGRRTRYKYNSVSLGNPIEIGLPDDNKQQFTYQSGTNWVLTFIDENSKTITYTRDANGNITLITFPKPTDAVSDTPVTIAYSYVSSAPGGRIQSITNGNQRVTSFGYETSRNRRGRDQTPRDALPNPSFLGQALRVLLHFVQL